MVENDVFPPKKGSAAPISAAETPFSAQRLPEKLGLNKAMKLRHRTLVNNLFDHGSGDYAFPLRLIALATDREPLIAAFRDHLPEKVGKLQFLITVPKKKRRHAVDRVLMRRRVREAFRLNRKMLDAILDAHPEWGTLSLAFVYIGSENVSYAKVEKSMVKLLSKLLDRYESPSETNRHDESTTK